MGVVDDHSGMIDLRDERWGRGRRVEFEGKTAAEMRALLRAMARKRAGSPLPLASGPAVGASREGLGGPAVRLFVEEAAPGLFRVLARDVPPG
ncbi:MAG TPA: hypothetical protein VF310_02965 [Vicinamibacteria bacterium]